MDHYLIKGWNFKFTDLQAVVGLEQMKKLAYRVERKKEIGKLYEKLLADVKQIEFVPTNYDNTTPWFIDILVEDREGLKTYLKEHGVGSRDFYPPLHAEPAYGYEGSYPVTEEISRKGLWLPSAAQLKDVEIEEVCTHIKAYFS